MTTPAPCPEQDSIAEPSPPVRSQNPEQRGLPIGIRRMVGLETAAKMLGGKERLAEAMAVTVRSVTYKLNAERGISDTDLVFAADALDQLAARITAHAVKLRAEVTA